MTSESRRDLTEEALQGLLERLHQEPEQAAQEYESLRARLCALFDWRGLARPEVAADEVLDRVARRLLEGTPIENVRAYAHGVARLVLLEELRHQLREQQALAVRAQLLAGVAPSTVDEERVACLCRCLGELPEESRALILDYYEGAGEIHLEERQGLAARLGLTYATLKTRAHRVRLRLKECLDHCLQEGRTS